MKEKSIWEMTDKEIAILAAPITAQARAASWEAGLPVSYHNELCTTPDLIIHEYKNGRRELVSVSGIDGKVTFIKLLEPDKY